MPIFEYIKQLFSWGKSKNRYQDIAPDEIFMDSHNRPEFNRHQFEGRLEKPITKSTILLFGVAVALILLIFSGRLWMLQIQKGEAYAVQSKNNHLDHRVLFAERGIIRDKDGNQLAWNELREGQPFPERAYATTTGIAHVVGYVTPPQKDSSGNYYQTSFKGKDGVERSFNRYLSGQNGLQLIEENALGQRVSDSVVKAPQNGENLLLAIDKRIQHKLYSFIRSTAGEHGYRGGAGVIMNIENGDIVALTNYPEYPPHVLTEGNQEKKIQQLVSASSTPFLNRASEGLYTPGSVVKPFMAIAALNENVISSQKEVRSTGELRIPNPYYPDKYSIFHDWKAHGLVDMREAIAVSSNEYFYQIGGGYKDQEGLGIEKIKKYMDAFGLGKKTGIKGLPEREGVIPSPEWKEENFKDGQWRVGDTYNTAIGQYGFQVTPLQMTRSIGAIAKNGKLVTPRIAKKEDISESKVSFDISPTDYEVVREGMRRAVTEGTASGLNVSYLDIAAKTGTAEVSGKKAVNSWIVGFFPYEDPKYAFTVVMEHGPKDSTIGGVFVMRRLFDWANQQEVLGL